MIDWSNTNKNCTLFNLLSHGNVNGTGFEEQINFSNRVMCYFSKKNNKIKLVMTATTDWQWFTKHLSLVSRKECSARARVRVRGQRSVPVFSMCTGGQTKYIWLTHWHTRCSYKITNLLSRMRLYQKELVHACLTSTVLVHVYKHTVCFPHAGIWTLCGL